jgi:2-polyprenyl-6-methoxyphenol hydroxylase-like FAD-dependent oxidoreductase
MISIHPSRDKAQVAFIFRGEITDFDYRDMDQHKKIVSEAYAGLGWRIPDLLARLRNTDDLYFDAVSLVDLPSWSQGRIALLGDAASCVSLLGDGSSLAITGAHTLATALVATADHTAAFADYETVHRTRVAPKQRNINRSAALLVPKTRLGLTARNLAARLWPGGL